MICSVCDEPGHFMVRYDGKFYCLTCFNRLRIIFILNKLISMKKEKKNEKTNFCFNHVFCFN